MQDFVCRPSQVFITRNHSWLRAFFLKKGEEILHLYLKEINSIPKEYRQNKLSSKGFFDEIAVQNFPIHGHQIYLYITRSRWLNEDTGQVVFRDRNLVADGTHVTQKFASFLKQINRFQA